MGQNVSNPFARVHCSSDRCRSRAVTSLTHVIPPQGTSDDDADLALEVHLSRFGRQHDRGAVSDHGRGRLEEQQRFGGHRISELGGVILVIPPDPDDLARSRDAHDRASSANVPTAASSSSSVL